MSLWCTYCFVGCCILLIIEDWIRKPKWINVVAMKCWIVVTRAWILAKPRRGLKRGNVRVSTEKLGKTKQSWWARWRPRLGQRKAWWMMISRLSIWTYWKINQSRELGWLVSFDRKLIGLIGRVYGCQQIRVKMSSRNWNSQAWWLGQGTGIEEGTAAWVLAHAWLI